MTETSMTKGEPWAIALVHGIGETSPLPMIQEVSNALRTARPELHLDSDAEVHEVHEKGAKLPRYNVIRHGMIDGPHAQSEVRIGTAHWSDITFYRRGLVNMVGALMMTAFGVRFFAQMAATTIPTANRFVRMLAWCLRIVLQFMVQFLAIVIFPLTFVSLIFSCMGLLGEYVLKAKALGLQKETIALASIGLCWLTAYIGMMRTRLIWNERPMSPWIFLSIGFTGTVVGVMMLVGNYVWLPIDPARFLHAVWFEPKVGVPLPQDLLPLSDHLREGLVWLARRFSYEPLGDRIALVDKTGVYFALLHCLQIGAGMFMISLTLVAVTLLTLLYLVTRVTRTRIRTFIFATVSVISIWIVNLVLLWPENLATFAAMTEFLDDDRKKGASVTINTVKWTDWTTLSVEKISVAVTAKSKDTSGFMKDRWYNDTYPLMWFEAAFLIFLFLVLVLVAGVLIARKLWCARQSSADLSKFASLSNGGDPMHSSWPRVILSRGYVFLVLTLIVVVPYVFLALVLDNQQIGTQVWGINWMIERVGRLPHEISVGAEWARMGVILFLALFIFFSHYISAGAKLVLDVVNHFTAPHENFPVRQRIERRFEEMVDTLLKSDDMPHLVIMAHSQGTVITFDALMRPEWLNRTLSRVKTLTVVTFGSPITHVYQEYFPQPYPKLAGTSLDTLHKEDVERRISWFNVYRIDDYVGTFIDNSIPGFPVNVPAPRGGHTNYWQSDVFAELFKQPAMQGVLRAVPPAADTPPQPARSRDPAMA